MMARSVEYYQAQQELAKAREATLKAKEKEAQAREKVRLMSGPKKRKA